MPKIVLTYDRYSQSCTVEEALEIINPTDFDLIGYHMDTAGLDAALVKLAELDKPYSMLDLLKTYLKITGKDLIIDMRLEDRT